MSQRRLPIINRGTYTRTTALDSLVHSFLFSGDDSASSYAARQIVSLGAGTDTRIFRLLSRPHVRNVIYHELDFEPIVKKKLDIVQSNHALRQILAAAKTEEGGGNDDDIPCWSCTTDGGNQLWCHGLDLRRLSRTAGEGNRPLLKGLRDDVPTLLLSECCLCYLEPAEAAAAIGWFTGRLPDLGIVIYEPVSPDDPFGRMMVSNLAARRIRMPTLEVFPSPADQERRLLEAGFEHAKQLTVDQIWNSWISAEEKERVDGLEGLDELEEWKLLAAHYIVAWGWRGYGFDGTSLV